jgi:RNA polymerase sigma-70 factor (ECF subfamily)
VTLSRTPLPDAELLEGITTKSPAAIAELFDRMGGMVRRTLVRSLGSTLDIDDLAQETFLTVIRRARTIRTPDALSSFVMGVAIRTARNELRRRALRRFIGLDDGALVGIAPHDPAARQGIARVYEVLERLDATSRVLFVLRRIECLELPEIASAMGISVATVKRKLARAEQRFEAMARGDAVLRAYVGGGP